MGFVSKNKAKIAKDPTLLDDDAKETTATQATGPSVSTGEALGRGFAQGSTLGFGDELSARVEPIIATVAADLGIGTQEAAERTRQMSLADRVAENRAEIAETQAARPKTFGLGKFGGQLTTLSPFGAAAATSAMAGAAFGGSTAFTQAFGEGEGGAFDRSVNAILPTIFGATVGGIAAKVTPQALKDKADDLARRSLGFIQSTIKKAGGIEKVNQATRLLLKNKLVKGGLGKMALGIHELREKAGQTIGATFKKLDKLGVGVFNAEDLAAKFVNSVKDISDEPIFEGATALIEKISATISKRGGAASFAAMQQLKKTLRKGLGDKIWLEGADSTTAGVARKAYFAVRDMIDDAITNLSDDVINQLDDKNLIAEFFDAKKAYQAAKTAEIGIERAIQGASGNRQFGLTDFITMSGQLAANRPIAAVGTVAAKKALESNTVMALAARTLDKMSQFAGGRIGQQFTVPAALAGQEALTGGVVGKISEQITGRPPGLQGRDF